MSKRRGKEHLRGRGERQAAGRLPADAYGGWTVAGDGRSVVGRCDCGEPAVVDCPVCGPQCQRCFMDG